jgi:hypothetical protein
MIIVGGGTRSAGARSHRSTSGALGPWESCMAGQAGRVRAVTGPTQKASAAATGHGSIPGSARRLDMRS